PRETFEDSWRSRQEKDSKWRLPESPRRLSGDVGRSPLPPSGSDPKLRLLLVPATPFPGLPPFANCSGCSQSRRTHALAPGPWLRDSDTDWASCPADMKSCTVLAMYSI